MLCGRTKCQSEPRGWQEMVQLNVVEFHTESCVAMSAECWTVIRVCETVHSTELLMLSRHELVFAALCL